MADSVARWLRTARHLEAAQLWHRARLALRRAWWERRGLARVAALRERLAERGASRAIAEGAVAGRFAFLGRERAFGARVAWLDPELDEGTRLWKTLLHEFSWALDLAWAWRASGDPRFRERCLGLMRS